MDFTINDEQKALASAVRDLAGRRPAPGSEKTKNGAGPRPHDADLWSALAETGLLGLPFPEEVGGFGASAVEVFVAARELGRAGLQSAYADSLLATSLLAAAGETELVEASVSGQSLSLPALAEPMRAFSPVPGGVTASIEGDTATVDGVKGPIRFGGSVAGGLVASATSDEGTVLVLLDASTDETETISCEGWTGRVLLRGAEADAALTDALALAAVALSGQALGAMETAVTMTTDYLKTRKQFGVTLAAFQALTHRAADMYVSLELARSTAMYLAMSVAEGDTDPALVSRCRVVLGRTGRHIGQEAIQLHGGIAMTSEYAVGHLAAMLTAIEHTYGDTRSHLASLAADVGDHGVVSVLG